MQRKCVLPALTGTKRSWGAEQCREQQFEPVFSFLGRTMGGSDVWLKSSGLPQ